eukprot:4458462-Lingulodinium_polyedra.AAC.1
MRLACASIVHYMRVVAHGRSCFLAMPIMPMFRAREHGRALMGAGVAACALIFAHAGSKRALR